MCRQRTCAAWKEYGILCPWAECNSDTDRGFISLWTFWSFFLPASLPTSLPPFLLSLKKTFILIMKARFFSVKRIKKFQRTIKRKWRTHSWKLSFPEHWYVPGPIWSPFCLLSHLTFLATKRHNYRKEKSRTERLNI